MENNIVSSILVNLSYLAQIFGVIFVAFYVYYTKNTLEEIKKQTDNQLDAYVKFELLNEKDVSEYIRESRLSPTSRSIHSRHSVKGKYLDRDISQKVLDIIKPHFPQLTDDLFTGNYIYLRATNFGKCVVDKLEVDFEIDVKVAESLCKNHGLHENYNYKKKFTIKEIVDCNGGNTIIQLISSATFPEYSIKISGCYFDIKNRKYDIPELPYSDKNDHLLNVT